MSPITWVMKAFRPAVTAEGRWYQKAINAYDANATIDQPMIKKMRFSLITKINMLVMKRFM
jgi:hypothetical protein